MKILLVSSSFRGGGITSYAHEVVNCFAEDNEMHVIIGNDDKLPFDRNITKVYNIESLDCSVENAKRILKLINEEIKPDVILNSNSMLMSLVTPYISDNIRVVSVSHSLRYNEADVAGLNSKYTDGIIALSTFNKEYLCKQFNIKATDKVSVVYNFVDELPNASDIREQKKQNSKLRIVFAGGTSAPKSPELVFDVLEKLIKTDRDFEFIFMGDNSPTLQSIQRYKSISELLDPDPRVTFTGRIPREEAEKISSSANIFLVPSRREGCPMAMIEAMRPGCIIITSDFPNACKEMIVDGESGFVIPHRNIDGFVERVIDIIDNHGKYMRFYDACYQTYMDKFSFAPWQKQMRETIENKNLLHDKRIAEFSESIFKHDLKWIYRRKSYNKYHMLFFETLKSAIPFYLKYIKKNYGFKN